MSKQGDVAAQTLVRRRLLENGYVPLANKDKMCVLSGWPDLAVDDALIDTWSRQLKWRATGVRVQGGLAVVDLDVNDADAIGAIIDALPDDIWAILQHAPVRRGKGTKEAWFCRLADGEQPFYRLASAGFRQHEGDETVHRVEIFADPEGGRQFGAYGAHTIGDDGEVKVVYHWVDDRGLLQVPFHELPALTRAQFATVAEIASRTLEAGGWLPDLKSKPGFSSNQPIFDLSDQVFETRDHGSMDLNELEATCATVGSVRLSASWLEGPSAVNMTRCIASLNPRDNRVSILETSSFEMHRPADLAPKAITLNALERLQGLSQEGSIFAKAELPRASEDLGLELRGSMEQVVDMLIDSVAFCATEQKNVMPLDGGPERAMTVGNFTLLMKPWSVEVAGARGGSKTVNPASLWVSDTRRIDVGGHRFRPDLAGQILFNGSDGQRYINSYRAPVLPEVGDAVYRSARDAFEALLSHLVPEEEDREWFRMWIAAKVQRPWVPNCGVILVAEQQGTGRGTLFDMLIPVLGQPYVRSISSTELMGGSGQGQYNEWLASSLLVMCEEVMAGDDAGGAMTWKRREVYERLKQLVDPRQRVMEIRRKGLNNYSAEVFASILMATNHLNALPLDRNDRRIAVLIQPEVRFEDVPALKAAVDPWRASGRFTDEFAAGLRAHLMSVAVDFDALRIAPELSGGRDTMRENNASDLDLTLAAVLDDIPGEYITNAALKKRLQNALVASGDIDHVRNWWVRAQDALKRPNDFGWRRMSTRQVTSVADDGRRSFETVYYREDGPGEAVWGVAGWVERADMLRRADDLNDKLTRLDRAKRDGRIGVV